MPNIKAMNIPIPATNLFAHLYHILTYLTDAENDTWRMLYITACNYGQLDTIKWAISKGIPDFCLQVYKICMIFFKLFL